MNHLKPCNQMIQSWGVASSARLWRIVGGYPPQPRASRHSSSIDIGSDCGEPIPGDFRRTGVSTCNAVAQTVSIRKYTYGLAFDPKRSEG